MDEAPKAPEIIVQMEPLAVRPAEAARILGVGKNVMYRLLASREIRSIKLGQARLVPVSEIKSWLDRRMAEDDGKGIAE